MDILVTTIELLRFEIDRTIITYLNQRKKLSVRTYGPTLILKKRRKVRNSQNCSLSNVS